MRSVHLSRRVQVHQWSTPLQKRHNAQNSMFYWLRFGHCFGKTTKTNSVAITYRDRRHLHPVVKSQGHVWFAGHTFFSHCLLHLSKNAQPINFHFLTASCSFEQPGRSRQDLTVDSTSGLVYELRGEVMSFCSMDGCFSTYIQVFSICFSEFRGSYTLA